MPSLGRGPVMLGVWVCVQNAVLGCNLKNDRMISVRFQDKPFNITVIQVYAPTSNAEVKQHRKDHSAQQGILSHLANHWVHALGRSLK